jgi:hypothetical protein
VTGTYKGDGHGSWLPFTIRLYFSAGSSTVKIQHLFLFDGDQAKDFIKGIVSIHLIISSNELVTHIRQGVQFDVPLSDELYDRHVRFTSASGGLWGEPVRVLSGLRRDATAALLTPQFNGTALPAQVSPQVSYYKYLYLDTVVVTGLGLLAGNHSRRNRELACLERLFVGTAES